MPMLCANCNHPTPTRAKTCESCGEKPLLEGRYQLQELIGEGAAATLYRAYDTRASRTVAVKERHPSGRMHAKDRALFKREARVLRELRHPKIPDYVDAFTSGKGRALRHYLVQEFVDGQALDAELTSRRYDEDEVMAIVKELAEILHYLHNLSPPVVHRDIKPGNIVRRSDGALVLVDFGAVKDSISGTFGGQTVAGTFGFMAPEQFMGEAAPASDIYGLGALAVTMLSRRDPGAMHDHSGRFRWQDAIAASTGCKQLLARMLSEDPKDRPTAKALLKWKPKVDDVAPSGTGLDALAAKGRRAAAKEQRTQERARKQTLTHEEQKKLVRLQTGLVGPLGALLFEWRRALSMAWMMLSLVGGLALSFLLITQVQEVLALSGWMELIANVFGFAAIVGACAGIIVGGTWLEQRVLLWSSGVAFRAEQRRLDALPLTLELGAYLDGLSSFQHSARVRLIVRLHEPLSDDDLTTVRAAIKGLGLGGTVSRKGNNLVIQGAELDLTVLYGKRLTVAISHHHRLHAWTRKVLSQVVLPARESLGVTSVRPVIVA